MMLILFDAYALFGHIICIYSKHLYMGFFAMSIRVDICEILIYCFGALHCRV